MERPRTRYARSGDLNIAYQVVGDGPIDLVHIPGIISHLDVAWTYPKYERFMQRLASFARVAVYDKRGFGLSDPVSEPPAGSASFATGTSAASPCTSGRG